MQVGNRKQCSVTDATCLLSATSLQGYRKEGMWDILCITCRVRRRKGARNLRVVGVCKGSEQMQLTGILVGTVI